MSPPDKEPTQPRPAIALATAFLAYRPSSENPLFPEDVLNTLNSMSTWPLAQLKHEAHQQIAHVRAGTLPESTSLEFHPSDELAAAIISQAADNLTNTSPLDNCAALATTLAAAAATKIISPHTHSNN